MAKALTWASDEPTRKVPGLVTLKSPPEIVKLSAVEPLKIIRSAVDVLKVTPVTVISSLAVKSSVAAIKMLTGRNNKSIKIVLVIVVIYKAIKYKILLIA